MQAGELTHQVTLQVKSITSDAELNSVIAWNDWRTVWAKPMPKTGREFYRLSTNNSEITEAFKMRYIAGVNPHQRVKFRGKYLEIIEAINEEERNIWLVLTCKGVI